MVTPLVRATNINPLLFFTLAHYLIEGDLICSNATNPKPPKSHLPLSLLFPTTERLGFHPLFLGRGRGCSMV